MANHQLLLTDARLYGATGFADGAPGWLLADDGVISALGAGRAPESLSAAVAVDLNGASLLPGFIDIHTHGAQGAEAMDATTDALKRMAAHNVRHGVTGFLPTTWSAAGPATSAALDAIAALRDRDTGGARILGAHLEGPYLNTAQCGAQDARIIRRAEPAEYEPWLQRGVIRVASAAPEYAENLAFGDACLAQGVTMSVAHSAATFDQMQTAFTRGWRHITHLYNATPPMHHREPGVVGAAFANGDAYCELIADLIHVHPGAIGAALNAKGLDRVILITDAMRATGLGDGEYQINDRPVTVRNGAVRLANGTLAGSVLTMDAALRNVMRSCTLTLSQAWPLTSRNAAQSLGLDAHTALAAGKAADLVALDATLNVALTIVGGRVVHTRTAVSG